MIIDTHCHLYLDEFDPDRDEMVGRAITKGVERFYFPAIDSSTHDKMIAVEQQYPGKCFSMIGLHPCSVKENYAEELKKVEAWLETRRFAAIGESGLDFYWDKTFVEQQKIALDRQAELSLRYDLPLILHTRNAMQETIDALQPYKARGLRGIFHCFGGSIEEAMQVIDLGFFLGIGGVLTYKKSGLVEVLKKVPLEYIVLETDAPYLTPVPFRGKRNESSYLTYIVEKLAEIKSVSIATVQETTTSNALVIFGA